jgi:hypothetical protein
MGYMFNYWLGQGAFATANTATLADTSVLIPGADVTQPVSFVTGPFTARSNSTTEYESFDIEVTNISGSATVYDIICQTVENNTHPTLVSTAPFTAHVKTYYGEGTQTSTATTYNNTTYYYIDTGLLINPIIPFTATVIDRFSADTSWNLTKIIDAGVIHDAGVEGVSDDPDAGSHVNPTLIDSSTPESATQSLKQNYPQLFDGSVERGLPDPDTGNVVKKRYVPVPWPNLSNPTKPNTGSQNQSRPDVNPTNSTQDATQTMTDTMTGPQTGVPTPPTGGASAPDTGTGDSPTVVPSTGSASSLWAIYNPTQAQIDSFGSWLWSSNLVDQIKKLFSDPMQAIIGVHKVFATPSTGAAQNIKVGYLDSGVSAAVVTDQYTTVDCGSVSLREYFGSVLDYSPFTEVSLYLPFIGIVKLDTADVMRSTISVRYHVDVLTGACLADVKVTRDGAGGVLYQYSGSAIVTYPVSSGSYIGAVAGVLGIAGGIAGTIASGGALAPALMGGALGATHLHADVQHSGGFSGSAGAMGAKKPYLIISRTQGATPNLDTIKGTPATKRVTLGSCSGFTKVDQMDLDGVPATSRELTEIETLLKQGVIV